MSSHYTRKTPLRNAELLREAKDALDRTSAEIDSLLKEAHASHKKPIASQSLFRQLAGAAHYAGKCMDKDDVNVNKSYLKLVDAIAKYLWNL